MQRIVFRRSAVTTAKVIKWCFKEVSSSSINDSTALDNEQRQLLRRMSYRDQTVDKIIRVNQAGERAAVMIYAGQNAILGKSEVSNCIQHMETQEKAHMEYFDKMVLRRRVRPSLFLPLWEVAGFALGAGTALLGKEAAMACTVAVEDTVEHHYNNQLRELLANHNEEKELLQLISKCRDEELEHKEVGIHHDAEKVPGYEALTQVISIGCRLAIWVAERI